MRFRVLIEHDEDGFFIQEVPSLPGCITQGETREEVLSNAREAIAAYLESLEAHKRSYPSLTPVWGGERGSMSRRASAPLEAIAMTGGLVLVLSTVGVGCVDREGEIREAPGQVVRDSAGVRVVESLPPHDVGSEWIVSSEPFFEIHGQDSNESFGKVGDVARSRTGRLAVVDELSRQVLVFDASGRYVLDVGRSGEGPGEFVDPPAVTWGAQDTLLTWDRGSRRITWFDGGGEVSREESLLWAEREAPLLSIPGPSTSARWQISSRGTLLSTPTVIDQVSAEELHHRMHIHLVLPSPNRVIDLGAFGLLRFRRLGGLALDNGFDHWPVAALGPDSADTRVWIADQPTLEVRGLDREGRTTEIRRLAAQRVPITAEMLEAVRGRFGDRGRRALSQFEAPDSLPGVLSLHVDQQEQMWIGRRFRYDQLMDSIFVVLDRGGHWRASVVVPNGIGRIVDVDEEAVVVVMTDELGQESVRVHAVQKR